MKKLSILIIALSLSSVVFCQNVSIKGETVGKKATKTYLGYGGNQDYFEDSFAGLNGDIWLKKLNDGTIYEISFSDDYVNVDDALSAIKAIISHYELILPDKIKSDSYRYYNEEMKKSNYNYSIFYSTGFRFTITDNVLLEKSKKEQETKAMVDF